MTGPRSFHPLKGERDFEWRGGNPTRVEALTDMVFAFALTLLVVSNSPPNSFAELIDLLWGFPGFAVAFAIQAGALRMAIARSLIELDPEARPALKKAGLLTRDPRRKESKKYGLVKARKAKQYTKR